MSFSIRFLPSIFFLIKRSRRLGRLGAGLVLFIGLAGCAQLAGIYHPATPGSPALEKGIKSYTEGDYGDAVMQLKTALDAGLTIPDQVQARKHLAFVYCVTGKEHGCADEFRRVLDLMPSFELTPAEAGHPLWGPVFRRAKLKKAEARK